ncbi:vanadium-dependent haloperoxidase [Aquabacterium sp.]|uniref:vanadium-dependent haloperoxidase n=1 Tax=Aquabacterium sp. TaxID=1872578 RepID=UPI002B55CDB4|nr:vanadium-dependent haloperoxidase [Aquabacterium sp.]HSW04085.1 vanadium-dependent haloperoxidase [Aquabacterium sp.]
MTPVRSPALPCFAGIALAVLQFASPAHADAVTDWNVKAGEFIAEAKLGTPPAMRVMAVVQTAVHDAVQQVPPAAQDAAVAAANRAALSALLPAQKAAIEASYTAMLAALPDAPAKATGIAAGERAAAAVLAARAKEAPVFAAADATRPHIGNQPGVYVPTALPAATAWPARTPWVMASPSQYRPGPPPALTSDTWARDFDEIKAYGGRDSTRRSAEQTDIARFWDYSLPAIYHGVVRSVALAPGRDIAANARLFATAAQAMDDALIAVFDAKHHYRFWRPVTAIRNADLDGHDATTREAGWLPLIDTPMHPEYPSGHSILAGAVGAVLKAEVGSGPVTLATSSPTAKGATRRWTRIDDFTNEVAMARVWGGLHYRSTNDTSLVMGRTIGELAVLKARAAAAQ